LLHWARDHLELLDGVRAGRNDEIHAPEADLLILHDLSMKS
jgi:hypothetical protein